MGWWIFGSKDKELEVAKSGDNYFSILKQNGEIIMAVIQPPATYDGKTSVGGKVSVYDAKGEFDVGRSKDVKYGTPIIFYNPNNKANLKMVEAISEVKKIIPEAQKENTEYKVNVDDIKEENVIQVNDKNRVILGSSAMDLNLEDKKVSIIHSPRLNFNDQSFLRFYLQFMTESVIGDAIRKFRYRSNIMLLDPKENRFKIAAYYNMERYEDKNISLRPDQGGVGKAFQKNDIQTVDLTERTDNLEYNIDPRSVWGEMKSIFCIPVADSNDVKVGVISIDSDQEMHDTRFRNPEFRDVMRLASRTLGLFLETKI